jgi:hypothetical protein
MQSATSAFDPSALLETETDGDFNTRLTPIPEGEFQAHVKEGGISVRGGIKDGQRWTAADVLFVIDDEEVKTSTQLKEPTAKLGLFLETDAGGQRLLTKDDNPNANVKLGKLKEAVGIKPGRKFSLRHLEGLSCFVRIKQRTDPNDIETVYSDVVAVNARPTASGRKAA